MTLKREIDGMTFIPENPRKAIERALKRQIGSNAELLNWRNVEPHLDVVLVKIPEDDKLVTWLYNRQSGGFANGHYFEDHYNLSNERQAELLIEATQDFLQRR